MGGLALSNMAEGCAAAGVGRGVCNDAHKILSFGAIVPFTSCLAVAGSVSRHKA